MMPVQQSAETPMLWGTYRECSMTAAAPRQAVLTDTMPTTEPSAVGAGCYQWTMQASDFPTITGQPPPFIMTAFAIVAMDTTAASANVSARRYLNGTALDASAQGLNTMASPNTNKYTALCPMLLTNYPAGLKVGDTFQVRIWASATGGTIRFAGIYFLPTRFSLGPGSAGAVYANIQAAPQITTVAGINPGVFTNEAFSLWTGPSQGTSIGQGNNFTYPVTAHHPTNGLLQANQGDSTSFCTMLPSSTFYYPYYKLPVIPVVFKYRPLNIVPRPNNAGTI